jgi:hypothetical protein
MATKHSPAFNEFRQEQRLLNKFLWSSDVAHETVRQKFLTQQMLESIEPIRLLFDPPLSCNAFIPPANHKYPSKYEATANVFREDIDRNLEANSKLVIIHFNRAFERFLRNRSKIENLPEDRQKLVHEYLKRGGSLNYRERLRKLGVSASVKVRFEYFLDVCIYQEVRHDIAHADDEDSINFGAKPWSDKSVVAKCEKNAGWKDKPIFPKSTGDEQREAIRRVCAGARNMHSRSRTELNPEGEPLIFFYALFSLGAYRRLADAIETSLPPMKH